MPPSTHSLDGATAVEHTPSSIESPLSPTPKTTILEAPEEDNPKSAHHHDSEEDDHDDEPVHRTNSSSNSAATSQQNLFTSGRTQNSQSRRRQTRRQTQGSNARSVGGASGSTRRTSGRPPPSLETLRRAATSLFTPDRRLGAAPGLWSSLRAIFFSSWLNLLLLFIPVSWALNFALPKSNENKDTLVFIFSFLAIIPLAKLLGFATEELSLRVGQTLAGLLNATLGNAVELIVAIIALVKCELRIVQSSLVGSILSNLLLVLGMCFFAGGVKYQEQGFGTSASQLNSSLLTISVIAVLLPAAFHFSATDLSDAEESRDILAVSRGTAVILLVIYCAYLLFQLWSHATLYQDDSTDVIKSTEYGFKTRKRAKKEAERSKKSQEQKEAEKSRHVIPNGVLNEEPESISPPTRAATSTSVSFAPGTRPERDEEQARSQDEVLIDEQPQMSVVMTLILLVVITVLVAVTAEWLVDSIDGLTLQHPIIHREFVGVILLPIVGNAAEHVTAVTVSVKDKLTLSLGVAAGSSIQIALFVIPLIVVLGWILGKPMTLLFDPYESVALFLSVLTVNYVVQDGKSNWLEGLILMFLYLILSLTFWFYPGTSDVGGVLKQCH